MNAGGNKGRRSDRQVEMEYSRLQDKCRGALVGGAVGDALGYAVEFDSLEEIIERFGEKGITRYVTDACGMARFFRRHTDVALHARGSLQWNNSHGIRDDRGVDAVY